jgi:hypothetical protein
LFAWASADEQTKRLFMQIDANSDGGIDWQAFNNIPIFPT